MVKLWRRSVAEEVSLRVADVTEKLA